MLFKDGQLILFLVWVELKFFPFSIAANLDTSLPDDIVLVSEQEAFEYTRLLCTKEGIACASEPHLRHLLRHVEWCDVCGSLQSG